MLAGAYLFPPFHDIKHLHADDLKFRILLCKESTSRMIFEEIYMIDHYFHKLKGGSYGNKILYKNLDLTQDFPNKISFHFLWVKMLPKNLPKIFRWPEMCPLGKILA